MEVGAERQREGGGGGAEGAWCRGAGEGRVGALALCCFEILGEALDARAEGADLLVRLLAVLLARLLELPLQLVVLELLPLPAG